MPDNDLHPPGTAVAVADRGRSGGWQIGTYKGLEPGGLHRVDFGSGGERSFEPGRIKGPGEIYIDARGAEMPPMSFSEALEAVHELARQHQPGSNDDPANAELTRVLDRQSEALATVEDLVTNHHENIDEAYTPAVAAGAWADATVGNAPGLDPAEPVAALRICLALAEEWIPEHRRGDPEDADRIDRARQACDLVRDLIGAHGGDLASRITLVPGIRPE